MPCVKGSFVVINHDTILTSLNNKTVDHEKDLNHCKLRHIDKEITQNLFSGRKLSVREAYDDDDNNNNSKIFVRLPLKLRFCSSPVEV